MPLTVVHTGDATGLSKGDTILDPRNPTLTLTVKRVFRREGKPFRVMFDGFDWQTIKPSIMVDIVHLAE